MHALVVVLLWAVPHVKTCNMSANIKTLSTCQGHGSYRDSARTVTGQLVLSCESLMLVGIVATEDDMREVEDRLRSTTQFWQSQLHCKLKIAALFTSELKKNKKKTAVARSSI